MLSALVVVLHSEAQRSSKYYRFDYGGYLGISNYLGDIGGNEKDGRDNAPWDMKLNQTRWALGTFGRYKINDYFSVQSSLNYLRIQCDDKLSENRGRRGRNLNFRNDIFSLSARGEIYIYNVPDVSRTGRSRIDFKSFAFVGITGFYHNPKTIYNGEWVGLRELKTEGQSKPYSRFNVGIPLGLGFYFTENRKYRFGFEMSWTVTFTDYLDDISTTFADPNSLNSQTAIDLSNRRDELGNSSSIPDSDYYAPGQKRGDSDQNDTYFYVGFTYSYVFKGGDNTFYTQNFSWLPGDKRGRVRIKF